MADQSRLNYGMEKLNKALDALEASINAFSNNQQSDRAKIGDVDMLKQQNAELTEELASVKAKANVLEEANNEVIERLDAAVENISDVLRAV
jgi:predicted transcriptional regulator